MPQRYHSNALLIFCPFWLWPNLERQSERLVYSSLQNFTLIDVHCRPDRAKNKFDKILNSGGSCTHPIHPSGPNLAYKRRPTLDSSVLNFAGIGSPCLPWGAAPAENTTFDHIFNFNILWWSHVGAQRQSWTRVYNYKPFPPMLQNHFHIETP